ncbi:MAG: PorV/PorQ family protein [bacterium]|nr:PorV/PorQ family protein [bacterium]
MNPTYRHLSVALCSLIFLFSHTQTYGQGQVTSITAGEFTKVGLSGGQFLKIGVGARGTGMAGAFSGVSNDVSSVFWNAAGIADVKAYAVDVSHTFWFAGMSHSFAAGVIPVSEKYRLAVSFTSFNSGDILITTIENPDGVGGGTYNVGDVALGLTFAGYLTDQFAFGITAKYVNHAFTSVSAGGFVFDVGTRYKTGFKGVTLGFSINSLGGEQAYTGTNLNVTKTAVEGVGQSAIDMQIQTSPFNMPLSFRAGVGIDMFDGFVADDVEMEDGVKVHQWLVAGDFETFSDVPEQFAIGTEYTFREFVSLRAGYRFGHSQLGLAGGVGLKYIGGSFDGSLDFSISPTRDLGLVNRLGITMHFN